ncbi:MAG: hypothetical protein P6D49_06440 [Acidimicrobiales bacterium]|nr:hypothetical protein [Acidimicrobiales bacterium]
MFLGEDLLGWLLLALGGAMAVGNLVALVRPPVGDRDAQRPPLARTLIYVGLGLVVAFWALGTLTN